MQQLIKNLQKISVSQRSRILRSLSGHAQIVVAACHAGWLRANSGRNPILIYQMGKVGSRSVYTSLKNARLPNPVFFIHFLSDDLNIYKQTHIDAGYSPVPYHIELGLALNRVIKKNKGKFHFKIISMVRDPIARQVSDIFQNPGLVNIDIRNPEGRIDRDKAFQFAKNTFSDPKAFDYVFNWFNKELKVVFGIDVFSEPFDRDSGWKIYRGENADALIIRLEDLSGIGEHVISDFIGTPVRLVKSNVREKTPEADAYQYVKQNVRLDRSLCETVYNSEFVRHFYSVDQIKMMIEKWS